MKKVSALLITAALAGALVTACGGGGGTTPAPTASEPPPSPPQTSPGLSLIAGQTDGVPHARVDGTGAAAAFDFSTPLVRSPDGSLNMAWLDSRGFAIRHIALDGTVSSTVFAGFAFPQPDASTSLPDLGAFAIDPAGRMFAIGGWHYQAGSTFRWPAIFRIDADGQPSLWVGNGTSGQVDGTGTAARITQWTVGPVFAADGTMIIGDVTSVRKISPDGVVHTVATGVCPIPPADLVDFVSGVVADGDGVLVTCASSVRRVASDGTVTVVADLGPYLQALRSAADPSQVYPIGLSASYGTPMTIAPDGNLYLGLGETVVRVTRAGVVTRIAGQPGVLGTQLGALPGGLYPVRGLATLPDGSIAISSGYSVLRLVLP